jgi:hypothetical protein
MSNQINAIRQALALCPNDTDRDLPAALTDALTIRHKFETYPALINIHELIEDLVNGAPDDFDTTLDRAATEYARRVFIEATTRNGARSSALDARMAAALTQSLPDVIRRLAPLFDKAAATLTTAARKLPPGPAATDPQAILDAGAGSAHHTARKATQTLTTIGAVHDVRPHLPHDGTIPQAMRTASLIPLVDFPDVPVEEIHPLSEARLTADTDLARIHAVRDLFRDYTTNPHLALLEVARGTYGDDITLTLAATPTDLTHRVGRVVAAHTARRLREYDGPGTAHHDRGWTRV